MIRRILFSALLFHAVAGAAALDLSASLTLTAGSYTYSSIVVRSTGALFIDSSSGQAVTLSSASDFTVEAGGQVLGAGLGYAASNGPGAGLSTAGAGHGSSGGFGALNPGSAAYGSATAPALPGSGGGTASSAGGAGGAALIVYAQTQALINGTLDMGGTKGSSLSLPYGGGGGSGGSIWIQAPTISGSGSVKAIGGQGDPGSSGPGGGGSGGRIDLCYSSSWSYSGSILVGGGAAGGSGASAGGTGTYYACGFDGGPSPTPGPSSTCTRTRTLSPSATCSFTRTPSFSPSPTPSSTPTVTVVTALDLSGNLTLDPGTYAYSSLIIRSGSVLTVKGQVFITVNGAFTLENGATIDGTGWGYAGQAGPGSPNGATPAGRGAGHGGLGGGISVAFDPPTGGGPVYDDPTNPQLPGSGGGRGDLFNTCIIFPPPGGAGGAALIVVASGVAQVDGLIALNGASSGFGFGGCNNTPGGGGSGGTLNLKASLIQGSGSLFAKGGAGLLESGGNYGSGGGGGGSINLCSSGAYHFTGQVSVAGGAAGGGQPFHDGAAGANGSFFSCGSAGAPTPTFTVSPSFSFSPTISLTHTRSPSFTASPTRSQSSTRTASPSPTLTVSSSSSPTASPSSSASPTITVTFTNSGSLDLSASLTLTAGSYCYSSLRLRSGAILYIQGAVTLCSTGSLQLDAGSLINGLGGGFAGGAYDSSGSFNLGSAGSGPGGGGASAGGGHGGSGGGSAFYALVTPVSGGLSYDSPTAPSQAGSGGGGGNEDSNACGDTPDGGAGGAALMLQASAALIMNGEIDMSGTPGKDVNCGFWDTGGAGGAGGTIRVSAASISGSGRLRANGGSGGMAFNAPGSGGRGGGGGSGGRINLCSGSNSFSGIVEVQAGTGGSVQANGSNQAGDGSPGTYYSCGSSAPMATPTPTRSRTNTPGPSPTVSPTFSASPTPQYLPSKRGRLVLGPQPAHKGQPICLYFDDVPSASYWQVFNSAGEAVATLSVGSTSQHCLQTFALVPGFYYFNVEVVYRDGERKNQSFKAVLIP